MVSKLLAASLVLSIIGAVLNFASGTLLLQPEQEGDMGMRPPGREATTWAILLFGLGVLLIVTGVLEVTRMAMRRMRLFGGSMIIYGIVMLIIGGFMFNGSTPTMQGATIYSAGMLVIGIGMVANGFLMMTMSEENKCKECGISFPSKEAMMRHNKEVHGT